MLDWKSRVHVPILHLAPIRQVTLRKYLQARPQFPYLVIRGLCQIISWVLSNYKIQD